MLNQKLTPDLTFNQARVVWRYMRADKNLKPRTHEFTEWAMGSLARFFGELRLGEITAGHLREYQIARGSNRLLTGTGESSPWKKAAANSTINHELTILAQILQHAGLWAVIEQWYVPRPVSSWSPREIPDKDNELRLFTMAAKDPKAQLAYWVAVITNNTSASGCELRGLRLCHLNLFPPDDLRRSVIYIPPEAVKNDARPRKIPLNPSARWAFECVLKRALSLGSCRPEHYLFPFRVRRNTFDPERPASRSWLRKPWERLRKVTEMPNLRPHDLRHLCITRMLEAGVEPEIVRSIAGHVSQHMMEYYSHIRIERKADALDAIEPSWRVAKKPPARVSLEDSHPRLTGAKFDSGVIIHK